MAGLDGFDPKRSFQTLESSSGVSRALRSGEMKATVPGFRQVGMIHPGWAVLYSCQRACYMCLRSGCGSDGNVYNVWRGLRDFWKPAGHITLNHWTSETCSWAGSGRSAGRRLCRAREFSPGTSGMSNPSFSLDQSRLLAFRSCTQNVIHPLIHWPGLSSSALEPCGRG